MMFPLGYAEGIAISIRLASLSDNESAILREVGREREKIQSVFCCGKPVILSSCPDLERIFAPLYAASPARRSLYLPLKIQELLLFLLDFQPEQNALTQYCSQQTEQIKRVHQQLTEHLDQRFTIEALSKQYLMNTATLKKVFKAVYGLPIATYMKEYRIRQAMKLLRNRRPHRRDRISGRLWYARKVFRSIQGRCADVAHGLSESARFLRQGFRGPALGTG